MDDAPGVAEVDAVHQLEHDESDLVGSDGSFIGRQVSLQVVFGIFKDQMQFFFHGQVEDVLETALDHVYFTILGCGCNSFKMEISRMAVEGTPSSSFSSFILFRATISLVDRS